MSLTALPELLGKSKAGFVPDADNKAVGPAANFTISVTNTGDVDADDVVLGFITPPGAGDHGMPLKSLFGFERVHVKAGQTVTVYLYPTLTEFAPVTANGQRKPLAGRYRVSVGVAETARSGMGYASSDIMAYAP